MDLHALIKKARGGRVLASGFLDPGEQEELRTLAAREGLELDWFGGLPRAERRVGVLHPPEVPQVADPVWVGWLVAEDPGRAAAALRRALEPANLGDVRLGEGGVLFAAAARARRALEQAGLAATEPPLEALPAARSKTQVLVVPSLRVDVVGAGGLGVSRSYFAKGAKVGKVRIGGRTVRAGDEVGEGDTLLAEGLGQVTLLRVLGRTKRGNYKVELRAEK